MDMSMKKWGSYIEIQIDIRERSDVDHDSDIVNNNNASFGADSSSCWSDQLAFRKGFDWGEHDDINENLSKRLVCPIV